MDLTEDILEQIERYLQGKLSPEEKADFEEKMEADKELKDMTEFQRDIISGIQKTAHLEFRKKLDGIHKTMPETRQNMKVVSRRKPIMRYLAIAASFLLLFFAGWWMLNSEGEEPVFGAPNKQLILTEKYEVQNSISETVDVEVYNLKGGSRKYTFYENRFVLIIPKGEKIRKTDLNFYKNESNELFIKLKEKDIKVISSKEPQSIDNE